MATLAEATLDEVERRALARFVDVLQEELGDALRSVWLYGSRARGEPPHEESDVDLLVVAEGGDWRLADRVQRVLFQIADAEGGRPDYFSVHVYSPEYLTNRREIRSFFIQEVDRDKIVLAGDP